MLTRRMVSDFDWALFAAVLLLSITGIVFIYSATSGGRFADAWSKQLLWLLLGLFLFALVIYFDYHSYADYAWLFYLLALLGLFYVLLFGKTIRNTKSWIWIAGFGVQPSEFAKVVVILTLAKYLSNLDEKNLSLAQLSMGAMIIAVPMLLVVLERDLGTALTFVPFFALLCVGGVSRKLIAGTLLAVALIAPITWSNLRDYHRERIKALIDPQHDVQGIGYQAVQSKIALGSGKLLGRGFKQGSQGRLGFLPAKHTDFIFAVIAEEAGFLGAVSVLGLYFFVLFRMVSCAMDAKDDLGAMIIVGVLSMLLFHAIINIGMVLGMLPVIGVPLPLLSYGGSSLVSTYLALGLVANVGMRRFVN